MKRTRQPVDVIGLCKEIPRKPLPSFMFISKHQYPISTVLPACCIRQTWLNRHFRCAGALLILLCRRLTEETKQGREFLILRTAVWFFFCKSPSVQIEFKISGTGRRVAFEASFALLIFFFCFRFLVFLSFIGGFLEYDQ